MEENTQVNNPQEVSQSIQTPDQNPVAVKFEEKPKKSSGLATILSFTTILATLIAGFFYFQNMQLRSELQKNLPSSTPTPISTVVPDETADWKTYTDSKNIYSFKYPDNWQILNSVPTIFQSVKSYVDGEDINVWLKSKMFAKSCSGPIIQNNENKNIIIAFEIISPKQTDGGYCWSNGYFTDDKKWKIANKYVYPIGSNITIEPEWKGDYFIMKNASPSTSGYKASLALFDRETYKLLEENTLNQILSTFKFSENTTESSLYKNIDLGFSLDIPNSWKGKYQTKTLYFDALKEISGVNFEYLSTDKINPTYKIFSIGKMTLEDWNKEIKITDRAHLTEDAKLLISGNNVFYYTISLDNPYSENDQTKFHEMSVSIQNILKTFKLTN